MFFMPVFNTIYFEPAPARGNCTHFTYEEKIYKIKYYQEPVNVHTIKDFYVRFFESQETIYYNFRYKDYNLWETVWRSMPKKDFPLKSVILTRRRV